jgi:hypothetical protein
MATRTVIRISFVESFLIFDTSPEYGFAGYTHPVTHPPGQVCDRGHYKTRVHDADQRLGLLECISLENKIPRVLFMESTRGRGVVRLL